jgi:hypothetical protein
MHRQVVVNINTPGNGVHFRRAGPREKVPHFLRLFLCFIDCSKKEPHIVYKDVHKCKGNHKGSQNNHARKDFSCFL